MYTVKKLAQLSGVSVRALHWYDEIGLLEPSFCDAQGYRYYGEEELLVLQQILFFKQLGFALKDIQKVLEQEGFDKIKTLRAHKVFLEKEIDHKQQLITTIDKTILRLKGEQDMQDKELYCGLDPEKQKEYEKYLIKAYGTPAETLLAESHKRTIQWGTQEWDEVKDEGDAIYKALGDSIDAGLTPESDPVQALIVRHHNLQGRFHEVTQAVYIGLSDLYAQHPDFKKHFDPYHPGLIPFIQKAIRFYAHKHL